LELDIGDEPVALKVDGFDDAILGFGAQYGSFDCLVYDRQKCIQVLVDRDGMDYDEALNLMLQAFMRDQARLFSLNL
jgi:hypothetical protein